MTTPINILAAMTIWQTLYVMFYVSGGLLLIGIILLLMGRGGGIGSAGGGGGGGTSAFGAKTGDVFTWITVVLAGVVILTGVAGNFIMEPASVATVQPAITPVSPAGTGAVLPAAGDDTTGATDAASGAPNSTPSTSNDSGPIDTQTDAGAEPSADSNPDSEEPSP